MGNRFQNSSCFQSLGNYVHDPFLVPKRKWYNFKSRSRKETSVIVEIDLLHISVVLCRNIIANMMLMVDIIMS